MCEYKEYIDKFIDGKLKDDEIRELKEHSKSCIECSKNLKVIESADNAIRSTLLEYSFVSRKSDIMAGIEGKQKKASILSKIFNIRKYVYAAAIIIFCIVLINNFKLYKNNLVINDKSASGSRFSISNKKNLTFEDLLGTDKSNITKVFIRSGNNGSYVMTTDKAKIQPIIELVDSKEFVKSSDQIGRSGYRFYVDFYSVGNKVLRITFGDRQLDINGVFYDVNKRVSLDKLDKIFNSLHPQSFHQ